VSDRTFGCDHGHRFDQAKHGYLTLLDPRAPKTIGDDRAMLEARETLLASGVYAPIAHAVADAVQQVAHRRSASSVLASAEPGDDSPGGEVSGQQGRSPAARSASGLSVADLGCGTGYYAANVVDRVHVTRLLAADRSPDAVRMTVRALTDQVPTTGVVLDLWRPLPLRHESADVLLDVFAPRNPPEYARVLRPGGALIVVVPTERHLAELRASGAMLDIPGGKDARVVEQFEAVGLALSGRVRIEYEDRTDASTRALIAGMGPSAHHLEASPASAGARSSADAVDALQGVTVSVDVLTLTRSAPTSR
jgi:SAM-dependent methyltransferase